MQVRALVAGSEEALAETALDAARADHVGLVPVDQDEVVEHDVLREVHGRASGRVNEVGDHVRDVAVVAGDERVRIDRVVYFAVRGDVVRP